MSEETRTSVDVSFTVDPEDPDGIHALAELVRAHGEFWRQVDQAVVRLVEDAPKRSGLTLEEIRRQLGMKD